MSTLGAALARFTAALLALAGQLLRRSVLVKLVQLLERSPKPRCAQQTEIAARAAFNALHRIATVQDIAEAARTAENLAQRGAAKCCVAGLTAAAFGGDALGANAAFVSNLNVFLRAPRQLAAGGKAFAPAFVKERGSQLLDLLRCYVYTQRDICQRSRAAPR